MLAASVLDVVETKVGGTDLEEDDCDTHVAEDDTCSGDQIHENQHEIAQLLLNLTTDEANPAVRRCWERHGPLAWKRLCTTRNPRILASRVKAISNVMNPSWITDPKRADVAIEIWEDRTGKLDSVFGETVSSKMQMTVLCAMLAQGFTRTCVGQVRRKLGRGERARSGIDLEQGTGRSPQQSPGGICSSPSQWTSTRSRRVIEPMNTHTIRTNTITPRKTTLCGSWAETTKGKCKGKELVSRAECSAIRRQTAPKKVQVKERKAKGMGGNHPRQPPGLVLGVGAQATF